MTGGNRPKTVVPKTDPAPSPEVVEEVVSAKDAAKKKAHKKGRGGNILASRMMQGRTFDFGKSKVGE